ncbi:hypothetical protein M514_00278 [Trichuris suis]|uniref:BAR domain-containing protein n=1 Tax=Trichuris suis TaxID=68888 RepID=A0A085NEI1_9BILA|nr:hypothetical protein M514_00278 [Trichuris suis]
MDFNFRKFTSDAATAFTRAVQFTEEKLGKAEKTELDAYFENLLEKASVAEEHTKAILSCMECYLQPNPTLRVEEFFYEKLDLKKEQRLNNLECLGQAMITAGNQFGPGTPYGSALLKVGDTQMKLGCAEREFISVSATKVLTPLKRFLESDIKTIQKERKVLTNKRLDLDACKARLRKAKSSQAQASASKPGSEHVEQAEADLRMAQAAFDKQCEILKILLEGIQSAHANHLKCLRDFVEEQMAFHAQAIGGETTLSLYPTLASGTDSVPTTTSLGDSSKGAQ